MSEDEYRIGFIDGFQRGRERAAFDFQNTVATAIRRDMGFYKELGIGVHPRDGGPYSLYCFDCGKWVPNTANSEMLHEGAYSHSHSCKKAE